MKIMVLTGSPRSYPPVGAVQPGDRASRPASAAARLALLFQEKKCGISKLDFEIPHIADVMNAPDRGYFSQLHLTLYPKGCKLSV